MMQSGNLVDFQIPEPDFGGFFVTNDKISAEQMFEYIMIYGNKLIDAFKIDIIMSPTDDTLFKFLNHRDKDFDKTLEVILHDEITDEHRKWESKMDIKFLI